MRFLRLFHYKSRIEYIDPMPFKLYFVFTMKALFITLFFAATPLILLVNFQIIFYLYKSLWAIIIGMFLVYFIVMCIWNVDRLFLKYVGNFELSKYNKDYFKFYTGLAVISTIITGIIILIEVI